VPKPFKKKEFIMGLKNTDVSFIKKELTILKLMDVVNTTLLLAKDLIKGFTKLNEFSTSSTYDW